MPNHRDYDNAPAAHRWDRPLAGLYSALRSEAWTAGGRWAWRVLPRGAVVSMRTVGSALLGTVRFEVRIARRGVPEAAEALAAWQTELGVFVQHLGLRTWQRVAHEAEGDVVEARFVEPGIGARPEPEALDLFGEPVGRAPVNAVAEGRRDDT